MNFSAVGAASHKNVIAKFTKGSSPYDIYKKIDEYYAKNGDNNRVLLRIYVNGIENIRVYKNAITIRNFLDSKSSISLKNHKDKDYFMNNLRQNHNKFQYFVRSHQKYAFSVIDFLGNPFIFIKATHNIKDLKFLSKIKSTLFKNINKYVDFHNQQEKSYATAIIAGASTSKVCKGCDICRAIRYLGNLLEDKRYSKIYVFKNKLINKKHLTHIRTSLKTSIAQHGDLSTISSLQLCSYIPYMTLFLNLDMGQQEYVRQILGIKDKTSYVKISHIKKELMKRNVIYIKDHGDSTDPSHYREFIFHEPKIHHAKQKHRGMKISVQFADGHEQIFNSISECAKYFGYSRQLITYHLDKLHSPLDHKIFQSF